MPNTSTDFGPNSGGRVKGLTLIKPIVYGNIAKSFGAKREHDGHTHQWKVYVKPYRNEDMAVYVKKVHFKLHDSYANPNRIVTNAPFEITETGWGEFEVVIKIYFQDATERPVTCYHILKLFLPTNNEYKMHSNIIYANDILISESYEEIIFHEPTKFMQHLLTESPAEENDVYLHSTDFEAKKKKTVESIAAGKEAVRVEINNLKEKLKLARELLSKFKFELNKLDRSDLPFLQNF